MLHGPRQRIEEPVPVLILEVLGAAIGQLALDCIVLSIAEIIAQAIYQQFRPAREATWWVAAIGLALFGAGTGVGSTFVMGQRVLPEVGLPGASLVIAPVLTAAVVSAIGRFALRPNGIEPSALFTWWGGAIFAFAVAAARLLAIS